MGALPRAPKPPTSQVSATRKVLNVTPDEKATVVDMRANRLVYELNRLIEVSEALNSPVEPYHLSRIRNRLERLEQKETA